MRRMIIFFSVGIFGLFLSSFILHICVDDFQLNELLSKVLSIVIVVIIQFLLNKYVSFRESKEKEKEVNKV